MLRNYLIVAVRNLARQRALSLINILGLAALVALGKVIAQTTKATTANPVDVLRCVKLH